MTEKAEYKTYTVNLRMDQIKYLRSLPNASEFLRSLIDDVIGKKAPAEKPKPKTELTPMEKKLIASLIEIEDQRSDSFFEAGYFEGKKPHRYVGSSHFKTGRRSFREWLKENKKTEELEFLRSFPTDESEFQQKMQHLYKEAEIRWLNQYPEKWRIQITSDWTLGELMYELERWGKEETTVIEVASILGVTYQFAYNKARPLLEAEDIHFVRSKSS